MKRMLCGVLVVSVALAITGAVFMGWAIIYQNSFPALSLQQRFVFAGKTIGGTLILTIGLLFTVGTLFTDGYKQYPEYLMDAKKQTLNDRSLLRNLFGYMRWDLFGPCDD